MKHGFMVLGKDDMFGEVSYGSYPVLREAKKNFKFLTKSPKLSDFEKRHLRLVELVEREIVVE